MNELPLKVLALVGATAAGAIGVGGFVQLVCRFAMRQKLPRWTLRTLQLLGGVVFGWIAALWLFAGPGGFGFGGGAGTGVGPGDGSKDGVVAVAGKDKDEKQAPLPHSVVGDDESLRVEVLGPLALQRLAIGPKAGNEVLFRVNENPSPRLYTADELKKLLRERQESNRSLRQVVLVLYNDSPSRKLDQVAGLVQWIEENLKPRVAADKVLVGFDDRTKQAAPAQ